MRSCGLPQGFFDSLQALAHGIIVVGMHQMLIVQQLGNFHNGQRQQHCAAGEDLAANQQGHRSGPGEQINYATHPAPKIEVMCPDKEQDIERGIGAGVLKRSPFELQIGRALLLSEQCNLLPQLRLVEV